MSFTKEQAKEEVKKLVERYKELVETGDPQKLTEEETKKDFILPLFHVLNWDTQNSREVSAEETISKKRVDYGFRINGIPKFFLEAKSLREKLETEYAEQAINYSWLKSTTWAVLTNFVELKVYNAEWKARSSIDKIFFELKWTEFIEKFDKLWLLSKDSFLQNELDRIAEEWGKKQKKTPVAPVMKQLFNDLMVWRQRLTKNISRYKTNMETLKTEEALDESVQRILDRLIFIRVCEDREIEPRTLLSKLREWKGGRKGKLFIQLLNDVFREFDKNYNSKLFSKHISEELVVDDVILNDIIHELYESSDRIFKYDFAAIDADVFGNIYEEYLGYVLKKGKGKVAENHLHRKGMGIYYTPTFVVDYIVKNTLGELLKQKGDGKIKVLDPACGSGSFLIKAFEIFLNYYRDSRQLSFEDKVNILKNNIFGVDLDPKAAEIAQLNLLLRAVEKRKLLPMLQYNIKIGNSLIDDSKIADNRAFDWNEEFKKIMKEGGFDVIIGNPPYVFGGGEGISIDEKNYFKENYVSGVSKVNLFTLFIEKAIKLAKEKGMISFIAPNTLLRVTSYRELRKYILQNCKILKIIDLSVGVFKDVTASTIIIILQKQPKGNFDNHDIIIQRNIDGSETLIKQGNFKNKQFVFNIFTDVRKDSILKKMGQGSVPLGELSEKMRFGVVITKNIEDVVFDKKIDERYKKFIEGRDIGRYVINFANKYLLYEKKMLHRARTKEIFEIPEKLLVQRITGGKRPLIVTYDNEQFYNKESINNIILKKTKFDVKYILALMNSTLVSWYYSVKFTNESKLTVNISKTFLSLLPIKNVSPEKQKNLIEMANKMILLNKELLKIGKFSDRCKKLQEEIQKIDKEINQKVYELYGLTPEEINIVESS